MSTLDSARAIVDALEAVIGAATDHLAHATEKDGRVSVSLMDQHQTVVYDVATMASTVRAARALVAYGEHGEHEAALALAFAADTAGELRGRLAGREDEWGTTAEALAEVADDIRAGRDTDLLGSIADTVMSNKGEAGPRHLPEELDMVRDAFRRFAEDKVMPIAEEVHRHDQDIPDEIVSGLAEMGCFALSIPAEYGGMQEGGDDELLNMVLVTEELSRGSLGVAGSLITRPEIIGTAIQKGGTEEQKQRWLPSIASGEKMCGVAVTEPDYGSDVAGVKVTATRDGDDWVLNGVKTWCTFAGKAEYLLVLARTDPDRSLGHKGLSLFVVDKPSFPGHEWSVEQDASGGDGTGGGRMEAKAIPTIGYRGMHSFEVSIDSWRVPHANLIGEDEGLGRGFYLQMMAFANARLQTAARALGVMQSAIEEASTYAQQRQVFATPLAEYELTRTKIARMACLIAANRAFAFEVARMIAAG